MNTRTTITPTALIVVAELMLQEGVDHLPAHSVYRHRVKYLANNLAEELKRDAETAYRKLAGNNDAELGLNAAWTLCHQTAELLARLPIQTYGRVLHVLGALRDMPHDRAAEMLALMEAYMAGEVRVED